MFNVRELPNMFCLVLACKLTFLSLSTLQIWAESLYFDSLQYNDIRNKKISERQIDRYTVCHHLMYLISEQKIAEEPTTPILCPWRSQRGLMFIALVMRNLVVFIVITFIVNLIGCRIIQISSKVSQRREEPQ